MRHDHDFSLPPDLLRSALDAIRDYIKIIDHDRRIIYANAAAVESVGVSVGDVIERHCYEAFFCSPEPCPHCVSLKTFHTGIPQHIECTVTNRDGIKTRLEISTFPIPDESGKPKYVIEVSRDVTERRTLEERLRISEQLASMGEMAASLAHEIRNPLGAVLSAADMLANDLDAPMDDECRSLLEVVVSESRRLNAILRDFLTYARFRPPQLAPTDINSVIEDVLRSLDPAEIAANGVTVARSLSPDLPAVLVDTDQIKQALLNVAMNAVDAMPNGGTLTFASLAADPGVQVLVEDTGPGIPPADLDRIFQPFYTARKNGTGLGLSIAHKIVEAHGGFISAENRPCGGARFVIGLPAHRSDS
ncbi:MAG: two-component system sensor histidine kinase NtrB [Armatimonadota bacterium]